MLHKSIFYYTPFSLLKIITNARIKNKHKGKKLAITGPKIPVLPRERNDADTIQYKNPMPIALLAINRWEECLEKLIDKGNINNIKTITLNEWAILL